MSLSFPSHHKILCARNQRGPRGVAVGPAPHWRPVQQGGEGYLVPKQQRKSCRKESSETPSLDLLLSSWGERIGNGGKYKPKGRWKAIGLEVRCQEELAKRCLQETELQTRGDGPSAVEGGDNGPFSLFTGSCWPCLLCQFSLILVSHQVGIIALCVVGKLRLRRLGLTRGPQSRTVHPPVW